MRWTQMKMAVFVTVFAAVIGVTIYAQGQGQAQGQAGGGRQGAAPGQGAPLQNLQVLPKDTTRQQVTQMMRGFAAALNVDCIHCHVGTMQDRPKDDNPKKGIARKMIQMTAAINNEHLKGVGEAPAAGAAKVTCFTCHRGAIKPLTVAAGGGE